MMGKSVPDAVLRPHAAAVTALAQATAPTQADLVRGLDLQGKGQTAEAEVVFTAYLMAHPCDGIATYSLALIYMQRAENARAIALLEPCLQVVTGFAPVWMAYANALQNQGRREEALAAYERALALNPKYVEALINSGVLMREMHRHAEALDRFQRVLAIQPDHENALGNTGIILTEFKRSAEAIPIFERLLAVNPAYDWGMGLLAYERLHVCDWTDFAPMAQRIVEGIRAGKRTCKSLPLMALTDDAAAHQASARMFGQRFPARDPLWKGERYGHRKIRLAYVSPDLREHPVGHLMAGIFEHHDKSRFETIAISLGIDDQSRLRGRMVAAFDRFVDARQMTSQQIAALMREMEVDIAVDLAGYTADSRTDVFAHRPAPVHVNYLGYPGTLGLPYMDYIMADRHVIPPEHQRHYDEQVVYLPDAYLPTDGSVQIAERTPSRAECGLPEDGIVFCSFSHDYKISPPLFDVWMRLLQRVPGSVLWLMSRGESAQAHLRDEARQRGVDGERLIFASRVPRVEDHLARYRQADLFLDTHPYNAHTTAADALMAGLPVVTFAGQGFPARVAASLLHAIGMPELVADSLAGYEALALTLAQDAAQLKAVRTKLAINRQTHALFDTPRFCRNMEALFVDMWRKAEGLGDEVEPGAPAPATPAAQIDGAALRGITVVPTEAARAVAAVVPVAREEGSRVGASYQQIASRELPVQQSAQLVQFAQADSFFHLAAAKNQRWKTLQRHFNGVAPTRIILGANISGFGCQIPGCTVEYLEKGYFQDMSDSALAQKRQHLAKAIVIVNNNDVGGAQAGYARLYDACEQTLFVAWDWDNHHWLELSIFLAAHSDLYAPAHHENLYLLTRFNWVTAGPVYCATVQWPRQFLADHLPQMITTPRSDAPLGKHIPYGAFTYRNRVVSTLGQHYPSIGFSDRTFHVRGPEERLQEWYAHKSHWIAPVLNDVAIRIFDALITGGIPIVPASMQHLPPVRDIPREHIVFSTPDDIVAPQSVVARANALFDQGGADGIVARHRFALAHHHGNQRMADVVRMVSEQLATDRG
jgi:protein O-GlcNAc transferase